MHLIASALPAYPNSPTQQAEAPVSLLLGCIADDFTGATDLANTLVKAGMRTIQLPKKTI